MMSLHERVLGVASHTRRRRALWIVPLCLMLMGKACKLDHTDPKLAAAITDINQAFKSEYGVMLDEIGARHFDVSTEAAFQAMQRSMLALGFSIANAEGSYYLAVTAPAPAPLDKREWDQARRADEPLLQKIASKHLGMKGKFARLEPDGLNINGVITMVSSGSGTQVRITFRFQEIEEQPEDSILPRREYPPPMASRLGYEKIWRHFEQELQGTL